MSVNTSIFNTPSPGTVPTDGNAPRTVGVTNPTGTVYTHMITGEDSDGAGVHFEWTGTLNGTITLWMSDKAAPSEADDTDWVQDTAFSPTNPAGSAGKFRDDMGNAKAWRKRYKYVHSSGTGTLRAFATVAKYSG